VRYKHAVIVTAVVALLGGGGAAAYALAGGTSPTPSYENSAGQVQACVGKHNALYVTSTHPQRCPKGMIPIQLGGPGTQPQGAPSPSPSPSSTHSPRPTSPPKPSSPPSHAPTSAPPSHAPTSAPPPPAGGSPVGGNRTCDYRTDTWSGDASSVGYSVQELSASNGTSASFSVDLNAHRGNTEVVGYPSDQCILYSAMPSSLTSSFDITPPASSSGLDYEFAYDIWLTTASAASSSNWANDTELMIWTYVNGQRPLGSKVATLSDGSAVWLAGTKGSSNSTISVALPSNTTRGTVNIASIVGQLRSLGYLPSSENGILDVEYGIEAPYGGGSRFTVNSFGVTG
jgi:hypothetical protein